MHAAGIVDEDIDTSDASSAAATVVELESG